MNTPLLHVTEHGLYCEAGGFHIDPTRHVERALITHAHADHARPGSRSYLAPPTGAVILRARYGQHLKVQPLPFGEQLNLNGVTVSFHPAGHILGSAQIRVEHRGEVWVVSGDYKTERDAACEAFEPVPCHTFITESTFALPVFKWQPQAEIFSEINSWWLANQSAGRTSVVFAYALGKAQRVLAGVDASIGPIFLHPDARTYLAAYQAARVPLPEAPGATPENVAAARGRALVIAPRSVTRTPWLEKFAPFTTAFASGWMHPDSPMKRPGTDAGFALSDHADWDGILATIRATGAERVLATHGFTGQLVRWLKLNGWDAAELPSQPEPRDKKQMELFA
ncbi:MAG: ligase-associated DNA damage response exonuclease [Verrucomicrobia bacterium]|nr:ligase-associated DNA damage response exonuclease [Verrucomicrobiota bacterium]